VGRVEIVGELVSGERGWKGGHVAGDLSSMSGQPCPVAEPPVTQAWFAYVLSVALDNFLSANQTKMRSNPDFTLL